MIIITVTTDPTNKLHGLKNIILADVVTDHIRKYDVMTTGQYLMLF